MMGRLNRDQGELFYEFRLEEAVPEDHLVREHPDHEHRIDRRRPARWRLSDHAEPTLRVLGERNDIIKRIHRGFAEQRIDRSIGDFALQDGDSRQVIGHLVAYGLDDELKESVYAVIDGVDGRVHHLRLPDLHALDDAAPGSIVELRRFEDAACGQRAALAVRSDLPLEKQVGAQGATWLDRQLVGREPAPLGSTGFGAEIREAMKSRVEHLISEPRDDDASRCNGIGNELDK
jgi:hypothetical protein